MQRCSLILWKCIALYYIHHLLGWKEVPALLTAVYKTESAQQMFYAAYNFALPTLLFEIEKKKKNMNLVWWRGNAKLIWLMPIAGLKSLGDTLSAGWPTDLYLDLAVPKACHIPPGGSDYVLYRETGLKHYGCFGLTTWVWHSRAAASECAKKKIKGMKRNAEWMADGGLEEAS